MSTQLSVEDTAKLKMSMARVSLLRDEPFFGLLAYNLTIKPAPDHLPMLGPVATDQLSIIYDPAWVAEQPMDKLTFAIAHEVLHCALLHPARMRTLVESASADQAETVQAVYNIACDIVVNGLLHNSGFTISPEFIQPDAKYDGQNAEQIFADLWKSKPPQGGKGSKQGGKGGAPGDVLPYGAGGNPDGSEADVTESAMQSASVAQERATASAEITAHRQGKLPAFVKRELDEQRKVKTDWRVALARFMKRLTPGKRSWARPSRRTAWQGLYLPSRVKIRAMGEIVIAVDTSGSVTGPLLDLFAAELSSVIGQTKPVMTYVVWCDAQVHTVQQFAPNESLKLEPKGGGGTDFRPVFDWVDANGVRPAALLYITDMYGTFPANAPDYPVLWVSCSGERGPQANFGQTIYLEDNDS